MIKTVVHGTRATPVRTMQPGAAQKFAGVFLRTANFVPAPHAPRIYVISETRLPEEHLLTDVFTSKPGIRHQLEIPTEPRFDHVTEFQLVFFQEGRRYSVDAGELVLCPDSEQAGNSALLRAEGESLIYYFTVLRESRPVPDGVILFGEVEAPERPSGIIVL